MSKSREEARKLAETVREIGLTLGMIRFGVSLGLDVEVHRIILNEKLKDYENQIRQKNY